MMEQWLEEDDQVPQPNIHRLLNYLKEEQAENEVAIIHYSAYRASTTYKEKEIHTTQRTQDLKDRLQNREITMFQYVDIASYLLPFGFNLLHSYDMLLC